MGAPQQTFEDWSEYTRVEGVAAFTAGSADEVVDACNWAVANVRRGPAATSK